MVCDAAPWHKSNVLDIPAHIKITFIHPYTPEMNPIEQIWKEIRTTGFHNRSFSTLDKVVDKLCETMNNLRRETAKSIANKSGSIQCFNLELVSSNA